MHLSATSDSNLTILVGVISYNSGYETVVRSIYCEFLVRCYVAMNEISVCPASVNTATTKCVGEFEYDGPAMSFYRPRGSLARALYEKQRADEYLNNFDKNEVSRDVLNYLIDLNEYVCFHIILV